jgi:hypothetical protein
MGNLRAIAQHADRLSQKNPLQYRARVARQIGSTNRLHFHLPSVKNAEQYILIHIIRILGKMKARKSGQPMHF